MRDTLRLLHRAVPLRPLRRALGLVAALGIALALSTPATALGSHKMVALTFDDGPSSYTNPILKTLRDKETPGTFFVVGNTISGREHLLERMSTRGHEIGNHTWSHPFLTRLSSDQVRRELGKTDRAIEHAVAQLGGGQPDVFRPPYGHVDSRVQDIASAKGMRTVLWDVDPADSSRPGTSTIVSRVVNGVDAQSIVLLHDGRADRSQTVEAVPRIIRELRARDYRFVTVSEFLENQSAQSAQMSAGEPTPTEPSDAYDRRPDNGG